MKGVLVFWELPLGCCIFADVQLEEFPFFVVSRIVNFSMTCINKPSKVFVTKKKVPLISIFKDKKFKDITDSVLE